MARRRKYKRRGGLKLKNSTIYTLFAVGSITGGVALFASYTQGNELLSTINLYLTSYFGPFSFLMPANLILFGFLLARLKAAFARPNVFFGFAVSSFALLGLFRSGQIGLQIFTISDSIFGPILSLIFFVFATLIGLIVFLNLSMSQVFEVLSSGVKVLVTGLKNLAPLLKSKKKFAALDMKQITIK